MRTTTTLAFCLVSLTAACMSEATWPHRDAAGVPVSTWRYRDWLDDPSCRDIRRAARVAPESLGRRAIEDAARCGVLPDDHRVRWERAAQPLPPPSPRTPVTPPRPPAASAPDALRQRLAR